MVEWALDLRRRKEGSQQTVGCDVRRFALVWLWVVPIAKSRHERKTERERDRDTMYGSVCVSVRSGRSGESVCHATCWDGPTRYQKSIIEESF